MDRFGQQAYRGVALLDSAITLLVPDPSNATVSSPETRPPAYRDISLYESALAGVGVPQFVGRYDLTGEGQPALVRGYWRPERTLHYKATTSTGVLSGRAVHAGGGTTIALPEIGERVRVRVDGPRGAVVGAEVRLDLRCGDMGYTSVLTTDARGRCEHPSPWSLCDEATVRVECAGYGTVVRDIVDVMDGRAELSCRVVPDSDALALHGRATDGGGEPIVGARLSIASRPNTRPVPAAVTGVGGRWSLRVDADEAHTLYVEHPEFAPVAATARRGCGPVEVSMRRGVALRIHPYGAADNPTYAATPARYVLQGLGSTSIGAAHANTPYMFRSVPEGRYCVHVMIGDCVAYGRAFVRVDVDGTSVMDVRVPCVDPGSFRVRSRGAPGAVGVGIHSSGLPVDMFRLWGGTMTVEADGAAMLLTLCAFGLEHAEVSLSASGVVRTVRARSDTDVSIDW